MRHRASQWRARARHLAARAVVPLLVIAAQGTPHSPGALPSGSRVQAAVALPPPAPATRPEAPAALLALAREQPDSIREAFSHALALAGSAPSASARASGLSSARELARAYAAAWRDSFLVRQAAQFERWNPERRATKAALDSLRRAGSSAAGREGIPAAMRLWRESLRRALALGDSAGSAAALGSLGAGFYREGELDSATLFLGRARALARTAGDQRTLGNAIGNLASVAKDRGDLAGASELYAAAAPVRARSGDGRGLAADQNNLGLVARQLGDLAGARGAFERALALNRQGARLAPAATNLLNLADLSSLDGDYAGADTLYRASLALYGRAGDRAETAFVLRDLGLLDARRGDYSAALTALGEALRIHEGAGARLEAVATERDLTDVLAAMGALDSAIATLRRAEREAEQDRAPPATRAPLALARADLSAQLNTLAGAETAYTQAEQLFRLAGDEAGRAEAQQGHARLYLLRQDYPAALRILALAERTQARAGDRRSVATTRLLVAYAQREGGDTAAAQRSAHEALSGFQSVVDPVGEAAALGALGEVALREDAPLAAESLYRRALARLGSRSAPEVRWPLHAGMAEALQARRAPDAAVRELNAAIDVVERAGRSLRLEERRSDYFADKVELYARLALAERARGRIADAFATSERLRARQMLDLLARGRIQVSAGPASARAREQDLRRRIAELTTALDAGVPDGVTGREAQMIDDRPVAATREALDAAQHAYAELLLDLRERDPAYAQLVTGQTAGWRDVAARLAPDEAFIEYLLTDSTSQAFVVTRERIAAVDLDVDRRRLVDLLDFTRRAVLRPDPPLAGASWQAPLRQLHDMLISPLETGGLLRGKHALIIAPHGELHFLSFAALLDTGSPARFLVERYRLAYTPSASVWLRLGQRAAGSGGHGILAFAPRAGTLPASRAEVTALGRMYGRHAQVRFDGAASESAFRAGAPGAAILHLATLGVLNARNPLFSYVVLAPAGGEDGRLEVHEVFGLRLAARLVVLSACQTGLGSGAVADVPPGDDWVGLTQAFLYAGAARVIVSLWTVEDRATADLMTRFYGHLSAGEDEESALAAAQREMLHDPRTQHPFYWAGFTLSGGR